VTCKFENSHLYQKWSQNGSDYREADNNNSQTNPSAIPSPFLPNMAYFNLLRVPNMNTIINMKSKPPRTPKIMGIFLGDFLGGGGGTTWSCGGGGKGLKNRFSSY
jgi:hypothetical protein